ncbi:MAG: secretion protein HlyD [Alphaproteobacteria bacterium PA2]|nr:MAG: secretion protein HlyD [Alphaproteobacteria bacterium PA2]
MKHRLLPVALVGVALALIAALVFLPRQQGQTLLSGYVEGDALYLASPVSGALTDLQVEKGARVAAGQRLFSLDPSQPAAARDQAQAEVSAATAQAQDARRGLRPVELAIYDANVAAAEARLREADAVLNRIRPLAAKGIFAPARLDDAKASRDAALAQLTAARRQRDALTLGAREGQVTAADSRVTQARAGAAAASARLSDTAPTAPAAGLVEDVFFQKGEWVIANQPVMALLPEDRIKVRFFVPETQIALYSPGKNVAFSCDGCAKGLTARIDLISPRPEFTPPVIYSRETRDRLVYLVEARPSVRLNPGQPVDVTPLVAAR